MRGFCFAMSTLFGLMTLVAFLARPPARNFSPANQPAPVVAASPPPVLPGVNNPPPGYQPPVPPPGAVLQSFTYSYADRSGTLSRQGDEWVETGSEGTHRYREIRRENGRMFLLDQGVQYRLLSVPLIGGSSGIKRTPVAKKFSKFFFLIPHYVAGQQAVQTPQVKPKKISLVRYCQAHGFTDVVNINGTSYGWRCTPGDVSLNVDQACKEAFDQSYSAALVPRPEGGMDDWVCKR